jgi:membrane-associated phospholipid phosphatase
VRLLSRSRPASRPPLDSATRQAAEAAAAVNARAQAVAERVTVPASEALLRGRQSVWFVLLALTCFGLLFALVKKRRTTAADLAITMRVQRQRRPWVRRVMGTVSWPGFPPQSRLIPPVVAGLFWLFGLRLEAVFQLAGWGTTGLSFVFKKFMRRPRPEHPEIRVAIANLGGSSFPSGHVLGYVGVYGMLAYLANALIRPRAIRRAVVGTLTGMIALVGPSRIYLGHHWFTDVLASYLLGTSYLLGLTALYRRVKAWRSGLA